MRRIIAGHEKELLDKVRPYFAYENGEVKLVDAPEDVVAAHRELLEMEAERQRNATEYY